MYGKDARGTLFPCVLSLTVPPANTLGTADFYFVVTVNIKNSNHNNNNNNNPY